MPERRHSFRGAPPPPPPPPPYPYAPSWGYRSYGRNYGGNYGRRPGKNPVVIGCLTVILLFLIFVCVVAFSGSYMLKKAEKEFSQEKADVQVDAAGLEQILGKNPGESREGFRDVIGPERVPREKLEEEACLRNAKTLEDRLGWITDTETVEQAMEYFYETTGVQPYLLICDSLEGKGGEITDEEAEACLQTLYDSLYQDEGHVIFVFMEYAESEYITFLYTGSRADTVIDEEAREIFLNNADLFYTDASLSDEAYFAKIFRDSADSIMKSR